MTTNPEFRSVRMALSFDDPIQPQPVAQVIPLLRKGLRKLIVINSYAKGKARVVNVDDHTHVAGRNGRGKTTLLRLIPLFYGEQPSRMVKPSGEVLRPIREYMFDALSSYLVFEYQNHDGTKLAILYYGSGDNPTYTLCDGQYESGLFVENGDFIESRVLNSRLKARGRQPTPAMGVMEYQAIIQGRNDRQKQDLRNYIRRFALAEKGNLAGVEKIASAMFFKDITFQALKRMAYSVVNDDPEHKISTSLTEKGLRTFFANFRAHQEVMKHSIPFIEGATLHMQIGRARQQKRAAAVKANLLSRYKAEEEQEMVSQLIRIDDAVSKERERHSRQTVAINARISELEAAIRRHQRLIDEVNKEESMHAARNMGEAQKLVDSIPALQIQITELNDILRGLQEKSSDITAKYERELSKLFEAYTGKKESIRQELAARAKERDAEVEQIEQEQKSETEAESAAWDAKLAELDDRLYHAQEQVVEAKVAEAAIRISEEFTAKLDELEQRLNTLREEDAHGHKELNRKKDAKSALQARYQHKDEELKFAQRALESTRGQLVHLLRLESPDPGSLLFFLRENSPGWLDNIGKVIREDLLIRPGLAPGLAQDGETSFYGIDIDLSKVDADLVDREISLIEKIRITREAVLQEELRVTELETELGALTKQLDAAGKDVSAQESFNEKHQQAIEAAKEMVRTTRRAAQDDMLARQAAAALHVREMERAAKILEEEIFAKGREVSEHRKALVAKYNARKERVREAFRQEETRADAILSEHQRDYEHTRAAIIQSRDEEMRSGGVSPDAINTIHAKVTSKTRTLEEARAMREAVDAYQRWLAKRPVEREEARELLDADKARLSHEAASKARVQQAFDEAMSDYERRKKDQQDKLDASRSYQANLNSFRAIHGTEQYGYVLAEQVVPAGLSFERIATDYAAASQLISESRSERDRLLQPILRIFRRAEEGTFIADFVASAQMPDYVDTEEGSTVDEVIRHLQSWYSEGHTQSRDAINGQCQAACGMFATYLENLKDFQDRMLALSRQLQNSLNSEMAFDAIRNVAIRLSGRVERVPYWSDLNGVVEEYRRWGRDGYIGVPPAPLVNSLTALTGQMANGRLEEVPENLIDMEILVDDGALKRVSNEAELRNVSSNGLSSLVMCMIFVAFVNRVRKDEELWLTWALDEIGAIDSGNSRGLLQMLEHHRIRLVSASPKSDESVLSLFKNHYEVLPSFEIQHCEPAKRRNQHVN